MRAVLHEYGEDPDGDPRALRRLRGEYWRALEPDGYPEEFVAALTEAGWLGRADPGGVRRRGPRHRRGVA